MELIFIAAFRRSCLRRQSEHIRLVCPGHISPWTIAKSFGVHLMQESAVKSILEEGDEYGGASSGGESDKEEMNGGREARPPPPPPRPSHTLSRQSFTVESDGVDELGPRVNRGYLKLMVDNSETTAVAGNQFSKTTSRKPSWKKYRPVSITECTVHRPCQPKPFFNL